MYIDKNRVVILISTAPNNDACIIIAYEIITNYTLMKLETSIDQWPPDSGAGLLALQLEPSRALVRVARNGRGPAQFQLRAHAPSRFGGQRFRGDGPIHFLLVFRFQCAAINRTCNNTRTFTYIRLLLIII